MQKICIQCNSGFEISKEDEVMYNKLNVPHPRRCPDCRMRLLLSFRNERTIYGRNCDLCKKFFVSIYHPSSPYKVYCTECFYSDRWDQYASGGEYDPNRSFFDQYRELDLRAPKMGTVVGNNQNCDYTNYSADSKDCYLCFAATLDEECMYGSGINNSKNAVDSLVVKKNQWTYENVNCAQCHQTKYCQICFQCSDSAFLFDCRSCQNCFMCTNLRQKRYCIRNQQYSAEEYKAKVKEIHFGSYSVIEDLKKEFEDLKKNVFHRNLKVDNNENVVGERVYSSKNCYECYDLISCEDCRYCAYGAGGKDSMDVYALYPTTELSYYSFGLYKTYDCKWGALCGFGGSCEYCFVYEYCQYGFGCNNMHHAEYCILNKQYSKEEYEKTKLQIIEDMKARGEYGEFFPASLSPFAYNESIAQEYFPLQKEEVLALGYRWIDLERSEVCNLKSQSYEVPDSISEVGDEIRKNPLICIGCGKNYKIIEQELKFYRNMDVPIPRKCPDCRHKDRLFSRNPRKLWDRKCANCDKNMKTSYSHERSEKIYCEDCYLREVY